MSNVRRPVNTFVDTPERCLQRLFALVTDPALKDEARQLASTIQTYLEDCHCWDGNYDNYEGAQASCPVHGAVRAFNNAVAEIETLRIRIKSARDNATVALGRADPGPARMVHKHYIQILTRLISPRPSKK